MAPRKTSSVVALEFGPSTLRFVVMLPDGHPANQVLSAGVVALEAGADAGTHAERIRAALAGTSAATVIASVPLRHAFVRLIDVPEGTDDVPALLRWDMAQYLARPLDRYALDFQPLEASASADSQRYLAAAYRLSEVETLRAAVAEAGGPPLAALDVDALAVLNAFAVNYPECLPEQTLILKVDAHATLLFRTQHGEYLGGTVQRENPDVPLHALEPQERAEHLMHRARMITLALGNVRFPGEDGDTEPERIFLCGDLAGDADFRELLKTGMRAPFALLNPFRVLPGPDPEAHPGAYPGAPFAATVGLALRAAAARSGAPQPPRIDLLRHLVPAPAPEPVPRARKPHHVHTHRDPAARATTRRVLVALAVLILAVAVGLALRYPEWIRSRVHFATVPAAPVVPPIDSARIALENQASQLIAGQQRIVLAWMREMETALPPANLPGIQILRAVFTAPDVFLVSGVSQGQGRIMALQEALVLVPGLDLRRSETRPTGANRAGDRGPQEFILSGSFTAVQDSADTLAGTALPLLVHSRAEVDSALNRFLEAAAFSGIDFATLPAPAPTISGTLQAIPYRLTAACEPSLLLEVLEKEFRRGSPFGIQRVSFENVDSTVVFLDIMAFSR